MSQTERTAICPCDQYGIGSRSVGFRDIWFSWSSWAFTHQYTSMYGTNFADLLSNKVFRVIRVQLSNDSAQIHFLKKSILHNYKYMVWSQCRDRLLQTKTKKKSVNHHPQKWEGTAVLHDQQSCKDMEVLWDVEVFINLWYWRASPTRLNLHSQLPLQTSQSQPQTHHSRSSDQYPIRSFIDYPRLYWVVQRLLLISHLSRRMNRRHRDGILLSFHKVL